MKVEVFNKENKKVDAMELPDRVFGAKWNPDLVKQAFMVQMSNRHFPWAHTKDRSEVRGGGKKPWAQKHTGRSRHGSSRSPLWIGGGTTFGPRNERDYSRKISVKMKQAALFSLISKKLKDGELKFIDTLAIGAPKTKEAAAILGNFFKKNQSVLLVPSVKNRNMKMAARNIPKVSVASPNALSVADALNSKFVFFETEAASEFAGKNKK